MLRAIYICMYVCEGENILLMLRRRLNALNRLSFQLWEQKPVKLNDSETLGTPVIPFLPLVKYVSPPEYRLHQPGRHDT